MKRPVELQVVKHLGGDGFYLFYCDESGKEMTDTYHESVASAMEQAEFEFGVKTVEWTEC